ncbi:MAG TPA: iron-sulfur cluster insertion protein ErpA [Azospirillum sp.]
MSDVATARAFHISDSAARRVAFLIEHEGKPGVMLRLTVSGGGCSGFQYGFSFDDAVNDDDHVFEHNGTKVVTDDCSLDLLDGSTLDYVEDLMGAAFQIKNPQAKASCGCGNSFAV